MGGGGGVHYVVIYVICYHPALSYPYFLMNERTELHLINHKFHQSNKCKAAFLYLPLW